RVDLPTIATCRTTGAQRVAARAAFVALLPSAHPAAVAGRRDAGMLRRYDPAGYLRDAERDRAETALVWEPACSRPNAAGCGGALDTARHMLHRLSGAPPRSLIDGTAAETRPPEAADLVAAGTAAGPRAEQS